jgi:hypothetical protein
MELYLLLGGLQLDVALEWHIRYHDADVFWRDVLVAVEVVPGTGKEIRLKK